MAIRNDIIKLLLHGCIGSLLGFLFMHPASFLIHTLILTPEDFSLKQIVLDCFSHQKFPMTLYFGALGFVFGLVQGFYSHQIARLLQNIDRLTLNEAANKLYERFFQKAAYNSLSESTHDIAHGILIEDTPVWIEAKIAATGYASGYSRLHYEAEDFFSLINTGIDRTYTLQDFKSSVTKTVEQIKSMQVQAQARFAMDANMIFEAHLTIVTDDAFINPVVELIGKGENAPNALMKIATTYIDTLSKSESPYLQEKINDLKDIVLRLLQNMLDKTRAIPCASSIIFTHSLYPSDLLQMSVEGVLGVVLLSGGINSHIAILARSLRMPMVVADASIDLDQIVGKIVLVDADRGKICVNPTQKTITDSKEEGAIKSNQASFPYQYDHGSALTRDGEVVRLLANVNVLSEDELLAVSSCDGIGLYRTEFSFLHHEKIPTEDEQYLVYRKLVESAVDKDVTFRSFDLGGDKNFWHIAQECANPLLGVKSTRLLLLHEDLFRDQIRAILRATNSRSCRIMFPMISSLDEFLEAKIVVDQCIRNLREEKVPFSEKVELGILLELPSVVDIIEELSDEADFLSLGSNDFVQYLLAIDRSNSKYNDFYLPHHPSVLRSIKKMADCTARKGKPLTVCGDMAHQTKYLPFLLGIGIRHLSMDSSFVPGVKNCISRIDMGEAKRLVDRLINTGKIVTTDSIILEREEQCNHLN